MRKQLWIATVITPLVLSSAACSQANSSAGASVDPNGSITIRGAEPQTNLLPANSADPTSGDFLDAMYDKLVGFRPADGATYNLAAESITTTDSKVYDIKVRKGRQFHDGTEVKAKNFVDAWNYAAYGPNAQTQSSFFEQIQGFDELNPPDPDGKDGPAKAPIPAAKTLSGLKVLGDYEFQVTLKAPFSVFTSKIGYTPFAPLPDRFFADPKAFSTAPIGNGAFRFVSRTANQDIKLTRFDGYQGEKKPKFKDLTIKIYGNADSAYKDLLANNLDFNSAFPPSAKTNGKYLQDLGDRVLTAQQFNVHMLTVPAYRPEYNLDMRRAVSLAINRDQITRTVLSGTFTPADGWVPAGIGGYEPNVCGEWCKFDPEKARALFAKSGFQGKITLQSNVDGANKDAMEAICNSVKNTLGVTCDFVPVTNMGQFRQTIREHSLTGLARGGWSADYPSIENFMNPVFKTGGSGNDAGYSSKEMDQLLEQASSTADPADAVKLFQQAHHLVVNDFPLIPTWSAKGIGGTSNRLRSATMNYRGSLDLATVQVTN